MVKTQGSGRFTESVTVVTGSVTAPTGTFAESLTISGVPVSTGTAGGGSATLQEAYDTGDGTIASTDGKPVQVGNLTATGTVLVPDGSASSPVIAFSSDSDTGIKRPADNQLDISVGGGFIAGRFHSFGIWTPDGTAANPSLSFINDPDTGMYRSTANVFSLTAGGTERVAVSGVGDSTDGVGIDGNLTANRGDFSTGLTVSGLPVAAGITREKSLTIEMPGSGEDITWFHTAVPITVQEVTAVLDGDYDAYITTQLRHDTDRDAVGNAIFASDRLINSSGSGEIVALGGDTTIPASSYVWLETPNNFLLTSGVDQLHMGLRYTEDLP